MNGRQTVYKSIIDCIRQIARTDGTQGLVKGMLPDARTSNHRVPSLITVMEKIEKGQITESKINS
jgi:hypothetical protein